MSTTFSTTATARPFDADAFDPRRSPQQPTRRCVSFGLGKVIVTPGAQTALDAAREVSDAYVQRHAVGDWTETLADEQEENRAAIREGRGVFSTYKLRTGAALWIATTEDRSRTVVFSPQEV